MPDSVISRDADDLFGEKNKLRGTAPTSACIISLIGTEVTVLCAEEADKVEYKGLLSHCSPNFDIHLTHCQKCPVIDNNDNVTLTKGNVFRQITLDSKNVISITGTLEHVEKALNKDKGKGFVTDAQISQKVKNRNDSKDDDFEEWVPEDENAEDLGDSHDRDDTTNGSGNHQNRQASGWSAAEMFDANKKFGLKSDFAEDLSQYTTVSVNGTAEQVQRANELAEKIENDAASKHYAMLENDDEERSLDVPTRFETKSYNRNDRGQKNSSKARDTDNWRSEKPPANTTSSSQHTTSRSRPQTVNSTVPQQPTPPKNSQGSNNAARSTAQNVDQPRLTPPVHRSGGSSNHTASPPAGKVVSAKSARSSTQQAPSASAAQQAPPTSTAQPLLASIGHQPPPPSSSRQQQPPPLSAGPTPTVGQQQPVSSIAPQQPPIVHQPSVIVPTATSASQPSQAESTRNSPPTPSSSAYTTLSGASTQSTSTPAPLPVTVATGKNTSVESSVTTTNVPPSATTRAANTPTASKFKFNPDAMPFVPSKKELNVISPSVTPNNNAVLLMGPAGSIPNSAQIVPQMPMQFVPIQIDQQQRQQQQLVQQSQALVQAPQQYNQQAQQPPPQMYVTSAAPSMQFAPIDQQQRHQQQLVQQQQQSQVLVQAPQQYNQQAQQQPPQMYVTSAAPSMQFAPIDQQQRHQQQQQLAQQQPYAQQMLANAPGGAQISKMFHPIYFNPNPSQPNLIDQQQRHQQQLVQQQQQSQALVQTPQQYTQQVPQQPPQMYVTSAAPSVQFAPIDQQQRHQQQQQLAQQQPYGQQMLTNAPGGAQISKMFHPIYFNPNPRFYN